MSKAENSVNTVRLRRVMLHDTAFIRAVFESVLPLYREISPGTFEDNIESLKQLEDQGQPFSLTGLEGRIFELLPLRAPFGFSGMGVLGNGKVYLAAFHLLMQFQRQGLGSQALNALLNELRELDFAEVVLLANLEAPWAIAFYQRHQFREVTTHRRVMLDYAGEQIKHLIEPRMVLMARTL